jgi:hypothetical protein
MNPIEDTLRDLPIVLRDIWTDAVAIRADQRDALASLCQAVRGDGFYEHLLAACDEASDPVVDHPGVEAVIAAALAAQEDTSKVWGPERMRHDPERKR